MTAETLHGGTDPHILFTAGSLRAAQIESRTRLYTHPILSLDKLELE